MSGFVVIVWEKMFLTTISDIFCWQYEIPADTDNQARLRAQNANKIYSVTERKTNERSKQNF